MGAENINREPGMYAVPDEERLAQEIRARALNYVPQEMQNNLAETLFNELDASHVKLRKTTEETTELIETLKNKAAHDTLLTNILNRRAGPEIIKGILAEGVGGTLLILDIDNFKRVNDTYGHPVGDEVLKSAAQYLLDVCRPTDVICRFGGEEFLVFFPNASTENIIKKFTRKEGTLAKIEIPFSYPNETITGAKAIKQNNFTFSGGLIEMKSTDDFYAAVKNTDIALYAAKNNGKNHLEIAQTQA